MRAIRLIVFAAPLVLGIACKKNAEPEAAPVVAAAPAVAWTFGPAAYEGSRADGAKGTLKVPVHVMNNSDTGLVMKALRLGVNGADGSEACNAKADMTDKAPSGGKVMAAIDVPCMYKALPAEGPLKGKATAIYMLGGKEMTKTFDAKIKFAR